MATARSRQVTKQVGEYLACAELCRRGFIATTFTGNVPEFDILAMNDKGETRPIQVKTIRKGNWRFDAIKFVDITVLRDERQKINGRENIRNPDLVHIFVKLRFISDGKDQFYVLRKKDLQQIILEKYRERLEKHGGRRPKQPLSTLIGVSPNDLSRYRNNWGLVRE